MSSKLKPLKQKKLVRISLISVRCHQCYNLQVFRVEGEYKKSEAIREYLMDQNCQYCKEKFAAIFTEEIMEATKRIAFFESIFGEIILKNNFVHYLNLSFPTPFVLLPQPA